MFKTVLERLTYIIDIIKYWADYLKSDNEVSKELFWWLLSFNVDNNYKPVWWMSQEYIRFAANTYSKVEHQYVSPAKLQDYVNWVYSVEEQGYID